MLLFSFWGIVISIFFIITAYIIFTNKIESRTKIIIIILLLILGFVLFMNLDVFQNYNRLITNTTDATKTTRIEKDTLIQNSGNYSLSTWIYIDDWNYKFGEFKTIIKRENAEKKPNPHIYLDKHENNIIIDFYVKDISSQEMSNNYIDAQEWCEANAVSISDELIECKYNPDTDEYEGSKTGVKCVDNIYECIDGTKVDIVYNSCDVLTNEQTYKLKNIPIQKWFNIIYGFGDNHTDIYLNGKLVGTKTFKGVQYMDEFEKNDFFICSNGGYSGSISRTSYYNYLISPDKAYSIYKEGFNSVVVGSLFSKYNASVTFYEDTNERAKYYIV